MNQESNNKIYDDDVIDLQADEKGTYYPVAVVKEPKRNIARNEARQDIPRAMPMLYEMLDGFVIGVGAIENFIMNVNKFNKRNQNKGGN
jgi:hypothetical protein